MNKDTEEAVVKCEICAEFQAKNVRRTMQTHQIPDQRWSRVSSDLFTLNSNILCLQTATYIS